MLALTRRRGEVVTITVPPSDKEQVVEVHVLQLHHTAKVVIGFQAEPEVLVLRDDVGPKKEES